MTIGNTVVVDSLNVEPGDQINEWTGRVLDRDLTQTAVQDNEPTWAQTAGGDWYALFNDGDGTGGDNMVVPAEATAAISGAQKAFCVWGWRVDAIAINQSAWSFDATDFAVAHTATAPRQRFYIGSANYGTIDAPLTVDTDYVHLMVFDGSQTDADPALQNAKRLRVWRNDTEETLTFVGNIPANLPTISLGKVGSRSSDTYALSGRLYFWGIGAVAPDAAAQAEMRAALKDALAFY